MSRQIAELEDRIRERVQDKHVIAFVSGGVDSVTAVALARRVVDPAKLHMYYIDNGFMRDEDDSVIETLLEAGFNVTKIDAQIIFERSCAVIGDLAVGPLIDTVNRYTRGELSVKNL